MTALRLARAFTGKNRVIKFDGCYHGHFDSLLVKSGSGNLTLGIPSGAGVLPNYTRDTISVPFNDIGLFQEAVKKNKHDLACVIVEPVPCNMGVVLPKQGFLEELGRITKKENIILIFDEVITGFRLSLSGAQGMFGIAPDLTCLGKIIGGGFPFAAVGGRSQIMDLLAPVGEVYQAGTYSGNPLSVAAGVKTLECLEGLPKLYEEMASKTKYLVSLMRGAAKTQGIPLMINSIASVFSVFFTDRNVESHAGIRLVDATGYARFFSALFQEGILFPPSAFEACFISRTHSSLVIEKTAKVFKRAFA
jgi:glutamate-1-semialdehyde 2,1-aminomutase